MKLEQTPKVPVPFAPLVITIESPAEAAALAAAIANFGNAEEEVQKMSRNYYGPASPEEAQKAWDALGYPLFCALRKSVGAKT
jgi:hypothetical protein